RHRRPGADPGFRAAVGRGRVLALEAAPGALGRRPMKTGSLGIAFASILLVAACGGGTAQPSPSAAGTGAATTPPRATVRVAIGSAASLNYLSWDLAKALGYFEDESLDVILNYASSGNDAATALLSGSVDFTGNSMDQSIKAQIAGKPTKMVVAFSRTPGAAIVVRADLKDTVKSLKDLKGKTVGATSQGSGTHVVLTYAFNQATASKDIAAKLPKTVTGEDLDLYVKTLDAAKGYISADGIIDAAGAQNVLKMNVEDCKVNTTLCGNVKPTDSVDVSALYDNSFAQKVKK